MTASNTLIINNNFYYIEASNSKDKKCGVHMWMIFLCIICLKTVDTSSVSKSSIMCLDQSSECYMLPKYLSQD